MNKKTAFFKKLDLTFDTTIYCLCYICFLITIYPVLSDLMARSGLEWPSHTIFFWQIGQFCEQYFYLPVLIPIVIVACCELYTQIFSYWSVRLMVKCIGAIFFITTMVTLSPLTSLPMGPRI